MKVGLQGDLHAARMLQELYRRCTAHSRGHLGRGVSLICSGELNGTERELNRERVTTTAWSGPATDGLGLSLGGCQKTDLIEEKKKKRLQR